MSGPGKIIFLFDVDNTLLDTDRVLHDFSNHLAQAFGAEAKDRYFAILDDLYAELGYADYLGAVQRFRIEHLGDPRLIELAAYLLDYPFRERLYPGAFKVLSHLRQWGETVILSDGDAVFQPRKVHRSGLGSAVENRVLIYIHKELMLAEVARRYPADRYVMMDDKPRILAAMKESWGGRLITVWPRQGHYALAPQAFAGYAPADITVERIADLLDYDLSALLESSPARPALPGH